MSEDNLNFWINTFEDRFKQYRDIELTNNDIEELLDLLKELKSKKENDK